MQIEMRAMDAITPYAANPRVNDDAVLAVIASLQEFGFRQPLVVDEAGVIICGHTRWKAAQRLGLTRVPVHVATDLSAEQVRAYRIADNKTHELADWDFDLLPIELAALRDADFDLSVLGFDTSELDRLLARDTEGLTDPDAIPEPPADAVTQPGGLYVLGRHRLLCGDATCAEDVERLLDGQTPFLLVTDPPYGVDYDPSWRNAAAASGQIGYAARREGKVENDERVDWTAAYELFPGVVAYVWHAGRFSGELTTHLEAAGFAIRSQIMRKKPNFAISRGHYHWQHEPCWYAVRDGQSAKWCGDRSQSTVWEITNRIAEAEGRTDHGTQKPVDCMGRPIANHGGPEDAVYDPFLGSGTTLIACERLGRCCFGLELSPTYCDVIVARWEAFTGKRAERISGQRVDDAEVEAQGEGGNE